MRITLSRVKPGAEVGTRKALMPPALRAARSGSVTAKTIHQSACGELVVQIFRPLIRQPSPSGVARVLIMVASEPAPGSDMPKHIEVRPAIMSARISARARSVTCNSTGLGPNAQWLTACAPSQL
jgi:hypothetical protein